jgi:site-specific recombinase XerD
MIKLATVPYALWPEGDRAAWATAQAPATSPWDAAGRAAGLRPKTRRNYARAYSTWLAWLDAQGELDPTAAPVARVTRPRIEGFVDHMQALGRRNSTIRQMLMNVHSFLSLVSSVPPPAFLTHPGGRPLREAFPDEPRVLPEVDSRAVLARAQALHAEAMTQPPSLGAATRLRDAALMGILHAHAPRVGDLAGMEIGTHLVHGAGGAWELRFPPETTKGKRLLTYPLAPACVPLIDDYLAHGRPRLPGADATAALWLRKNGGPLDVVGVAGLVARRHRDWLGAPHGPHKARHWLTRTARRLGPAAAFDVAAMLGHGPEVSLRSYADAVEVEACARYATGMERLQAASERRVALDAARPRPLPSAPTAEESEER